MYIKIIISQNKYMTNINSSGYSTGVQFHNSTPAKGPKQQKEGGEKKTMICF